MAVRSSSPPTPLDARLSVGPTATALLAVGALAALCCARLMAPADASSGPVVCPFRLLTGLPCPGCGMTRAWVYVTHGDLGAALAANPFVFALLPAAVALVAGVAGAVVRRRPMPDIGRVLRAPATKVVLVAWLAFAVVRIMAVLSGHAST